MVVVVVVVESPTAVVVVDAVGQPMLSLLVVDGTSIVDHKMACKVAS